MLVLAVLGLGTQVPASAHSQLIGSDPAAGASLDRAPTTVTLTFSEEVEPQFATVTIAVAGGAPAEVQSRVQGPEVVADVPAATGQESPAAATTPWQVAYRVVSGDGHPITRTIDFAVTSMAPVSPSPSPSISTPAESAPTTSAVGSGVCTPTPPP